MVWAGAIVILGLVGYLRPVRPIADAMIGLIFLVIIIRNKGEYDQNNAALRNPATINPPAQTPAPASTVTPSNVLPQPDANTQPGSIIPYLPN